MRLIMGDFQVNAHIVEKNEFVSQHTNKTLQQLKIFITVNGENINQQFLDLVEKGKKEAFDSLDNEGNIEKKWIITSNSWSYRDGEQLYQHKLDIQESEILVIDTLQIGNLNTNPYYYSENIVEGELKIEARVLFTNEQFIEYKELVNTKEEVQVIRHGINDAPIKMISNYGYWSKDDDTIKQEVNLVEVTDNPHKRPLFATFQWLRNMRDIISKNRTIIDELLLLLKTKGILSEKEIEFIHDKAADEYLNVCYEVFMVNDLDELLE